ncbi:MAG: rhamnogalacturonan acetylesterase [Tepidisphaeraceae bacterium]
MAIGIVSASASIVSADVVANHFKFVFAGPDIAGATRVPFEQTYADDKGFGFEPVTDPKSHAKTFSMKVPEANYKVTVTLGGDAPADTTVKAETRRLMVHDLHTDAGQTVTRTFTVNVRTPAIPGGKQVKLNDREKITYTWDDKLTLEFNGNSPAVRAIEVEPAPKGITVFLAGDSTVTDQGGEPWAGWGQMLPLFVAPDVAVANHAESGRTLRSFRGDRRWDKVLSQLSSGDVVLIQFGHNDMKEKGDGIGPHTSYAADLKKYVAEVRERGATPVIVTSMNRRSFDDTGHVQNTFGEYIDAARKVAADEEVALIDLNAMSKTLYETWGPKNSTCGFVHYPAGTFPGQTDALKDNTHHNAYGAYELARCVVEAIRTGAVPELSKHLAEDVKPFDPSKPDDADQFIWPYSPPRVALAAPEGK